MNLTLSDKAYTHINSLLKEHNSTWARLQVKAGKCAGLVYDWTFDTSKTDDDKEIDGVLLVDKSNEPYLSGIEIGYKADLMGSEFTYINPKAQAACGCGISFHVEAQMINFKDFLTEGVYDKHIFKGFFIAGGPGSGKSWVSARTLEGSGMKVINTDLGLERYAMKIGLDLKMDTMTPFEKKLKDGFRTRAKRGTQTQLQLAIDGRLGLILDSTGRDIPRIESEKRGLDYVGYDTYCIFVNTRLEVALKRNQLRTRTVPDAIVMQNWKAVQKNRKKLQNIFGSSNYLEVDNNEDLQYINNQVYKSINKLKKKSYSKQMAKDWVANELEKKRATGAAATKKKGFFSRFKK